MHMLNFQRKEEVTASKEKMLHFRQHIIREYLEYYNLENLR